MASRFRILESLAGSRTAQSATPWRDRALSLVPSGDATAYDVVPNDAPLELVPSANGTHPLVPFSLDAIEQPRPATGTLIRPASPAPAVRPAPAGPTDGTGAFAIDAAVRHTGYLTGISLSGILQMLHMERNSCVLEVTAGGRYGTLTMVNGELIDAEVGDDCGDAVALRILRWTSPATSILPSSSLVRHSVSTPLTQLLMDAVRIQDEAIILPDAVAAVAADPAAQAIPPRWRELPERLVALGACIASILTPSSDEPAAQAGTDADQAATAASVARGVRTWSSLLVDGVDRVHVIAGNRRLVLAALAPDTAAFVYLEVPADLPLGAIWQAIVDAG